MTTAAILLCLLCLAQGHQVLQQSPSLLLHAPVHLSPACWRDSLQILQGLDESTEHLALGTSLCNEMSFLHQKVLAIEMARCHLSDMDRPLFTDQDGCPSPLLEEKRLRFCLTQMTDVGVHSYTEFFTHVYQACLRLTQETWLVQQQLASEELTRVSQEASRHFGDFVQQQDEIWERSHQREERIQLEQGVFLASMTNQRMQFEEQTKQLHRNQQESIEKFQEDFLERLKAREDELAAQQAEWMEKHSSWFNQSSIRYEEQQNQMEQLAEIVEGTTKKIQPLFAIDSFINTLTASLQLVTILTETFATVILVLTVTWPSWFRSARHPMLVLALFVFGGEVGLPFWMKEPEFSHEDRQKIRCVLWTATIVLHCVLFLFGFLRTVCQGCWRQREIAKQDSMELEHIETIKQMEKAAKAQHQRALQREERLLQALQQARAVSLPSLPISYLSSCPPGPQPLETPPHREVLVGDHQERSTLVNSTPTTKLVSPEVALDSERLCQMHTISQERTLQGAVGHEPNMATRGEKRERQTTEYDEPDPAPEPKKARPSR